MADAKGPVFNPVTDLKILIAVVSFLWIVWYVTGGPAKYDVSQKVLLKPLWPLDVGGSYAEIPTDIVIKKDKGGGAEKQQLIPEQVQAPKQENSLIGVQTINLTKANLNSNGYSYITLDFPASNDRAVDLTGLTLRDLLDRTVTIGGAASLPYQGILNEEVDISLPPGSKAFLIDGESPIGVSFRINKCFGYLTQFQEYFPPIQARCAECQYGNGQDSNYNSCVSYRKNDPDFFVNEWYIYLKNGDRLWSAKGDIIRLLDKDGKQVSSVIY
ncbi:MAG: hypothetical protein HY225_00200 [Candidatus Vogelbacteria bacterium]|nr:hypothetical protein [Candidatus Vogelbacteria bacterium]